MKSFKFLGNLAAITALYTLTSLTQAADNSTLIAQARSAAPSMVSDEATIMYRGEVLAKGSNDWICLPETLPDDNAPMCNDGQWMAMMKAVGSKAPFQPKGLGFSYMLRGDAGVSNSTPYHEDTANAPDFILEGPHIMLIVPKELLSGITDDPHAGGPYVMWRDTPYAHLMIPVGERP
jgi:hypothetical protein